jgi:formylmethanofuran dehydrogenase subunit E
MSKEKDSKNSNQIECCVKNCGEKISTDEAMIINDQYFCRICGTAYYRTFLNI